MSPEIAGTVADGFAEAVRENEERWLSPLAVRSYETRGRENPEEECRLRTPFQRDRDRIVHSKAFRRLRFKTQVFVDPEGDHFRTRLTHTIETTGIARGVARALRLNEDLVEAIGLGRESPGFDQVSLDAHREQLIHCGFLCAVRKVSGFAAPARAGAARRAISAAAARGCRPSS